MVQDTRWTSYDLIFFDCDSTLSTIEGIDELAKLKGKEQRVGLLTQKAMDGDLDLEEVYGKRLKAIRPTRGQLKAIEERYYETLVPDVQAPSSPVWRAILCRNPCRGFRCWLRRQRKGRTDRTSRTSETRRDNATF